MASAAVLAAAENHTLNGRWMHLWSGQKTSAAKYWKHVLTCTIQTYRKFSAPDGKQCRIPTSSHTTRSNHVSLNYIWNSIQTIVIGRVRNERASSTVRKCVSPNTKCWCAIDAPKCGSSGVAMDPVQLQWAHPMDLATIPATTTCMICQLHRLPEVDRATPDPARPDICCKATIIRRTVYRRPDSRLSWIHVTTTEPNLWWPLIAGRHHPNTSGTPTWLSCKAKKMKSKQKCKTRAKREETNRTLMIRKPVIIQNCTKKKFEITSRDPVTDDERIWCDEFRARWTSNYIYVCRNKKNEDFSNSNTLYPMCTQQMKTVLCVKQ